MSYYQEIQKEAIQIIPNKFYFYPNKNIKHLTPEGVKIVNYDKEFIYQSYNKDFGPTNIQQITIYARKILDEIQRLVKLNLKKEQLKYYPYEDKISQKSASSMNISDNQKLKENRILEQSKKDLPIILVHQCNPMPKTLANQLVLVGSFMIIQLHFSAKEAWKKLIKLHQKLIPFCDSGTRNNPFEIEVYDCLNAVEIAINKKWYQFDIFDVKEYAAMSDVEEGDMNWILPNQILAMSSPSTYEQDGGLKPKKYISFFKRQKISSLIRLNSKLYNDNEFEKEGIKIYDLEYPDGSNPCDQIIQQFIRICQSEISRGNAIAVHCRAGLGRTGTLIGLFMMNKYGLDVKTTIAWLRLCRPGSVVGDQQQFLEEMQDNIKLVMKQQVYDKNFEIKQSRNSQQNRRQQVRFQDEYVSFQNSDFNLVDQRMNPGNQNQFLRHQNYEMSPVRKQLRPQTADFSSDSLSDRSAKQQYYNNPSKNRCSDQIDIFYELSDNYDQKKIQNEKKGVINRILKKKDIIEKKDINPKQLFQRDLDKQFINENKISTVKPPLRVRKIDFYNNESSDDENSGFNKYKEKIEESKPYFSPQKQTGLTLYDLQMHSNNKNKLKRLINDFKEKQQQIEKIDDNSYIKSYYQKKYGYQKIDEDILINEAQKQNRENNTTPLRVKSRSPNKNEDEHSEYSSQQKQNKSGSNSYKLSQGELLKSKKRENQSSQKQNSRKINMQTPLKNKEKNDYALTNSSQLNQFSDAYHRPRIGRIDAYGIQPKTLFQNQNFDQDEFIKDKSKDFKSNIKQQQIKYGNNYLSSSEDENYSNVKKNYNNVTPIKSNNQKVMEKSQSKSAISDKKQIQDKKQQVEQKKTNNSIIGSLGTRKLTILEMKILEKTKKNLEEKQNNNQFNKK